MDDGGGGGSLSPGLIEDLLRSGGGSIDAPSGGVARGGARGGVVDLMPQVEKLRILYDIFGN